MRQVSCESKPGGRQWFFRGGRPKCQTTQLTRSGSGPRITSRFPAHSITAVARTACAGRGGFQRTEPGVSEVQRSESDPRQFFVHGITTEGRPFRPSDWAERLAGVLSCYRPGGIASGRDAFIGYSPYVRPMVVDGVKCVLVDERLRAVERMAFDFVMNFARDNGLPVYEARALPDGSSVPDPGRPRAT